MGLFLESEGVRSILLSPLNTVDHDLSIFPFRTSLPCVGFCGHRCPGNDRLEAGSLVRWPDPLSPAMISSPTRSWDQRRNKLLKGANVHVPHNDSSKLRKASLASGFVKKSGKHLLFTVGRRRM
jgi:hypothetical protein